MGHGASSALCRDARLASSQFCSRRCHNLGDDGSATRSDRWSVCAGHRLHRLQREHGTKPLLVRERHIEGPVLLEQGRADHRVHEPSRLDESGMSREHGVLRLESGERVSGQRHRLEDRETELAQSIVDRLVPTRLAQR